MADVDTRTGRCLCRSVSYQAVLAKHEMDVCHCGMCRRWSGGVFMAVPCSSLRIEGGDAVGVYTSSDWAERVFCRMCGSSIAWRMRGGGFEAVSFQSLDDQRGLAFAEEIFIDDKPPLYSFAGERRRKTGAEVIAEVTGAAPGHPQ